MVNTPPKLTKNKKEPRMGKYEDLQQLISSFEGDFRKFYEKQNKAAGTRVRKNMGELKKFAQQIRQEVQEIKLKMKEEESK
jgi:hypothetical protein